jgi:4-amino-4-deoxy-L-arabinose transferase-like glycosyltransferase
MSASRSSDANEMPSFERTARTPLNKRLSAVRLPNIRIVLVLAAFLRILSIPLVHSFRHPNTWEFGPLARSLAGGFGYSEVLTNGIRVPAIYMPPAYSYFLACFYWLAGERPTTYIAIEIIQAGFGVLLVYLVYRLAFLVVGQGGAIGAACLVAIYPAQIYMCNEFHGISIYIVLGVAAVFFLVRYLELTNSWRDICGAGLCMGLLMLFRGEGAALALLYFAILLVRGRRKALVPATAFLLIAYACLAPWVLRNYREFDKIILVCASGGRNLWIGNNPRATGSQHYNQFNPMPADVKSALESLRPSPKASVEKDEAFKHLALNYMRTHPFDEVRLSLKKLYIFFVFDPSHPKGRDPVYWIPSVLLSFCAIWGGWLRGRKLFTTDLFLVGSIAFAVAITMIVFALPRYKIVIDPFIMIIAANLLAVRDPTTLLTRSREVISRAPPTRFASPVAHVNDSAYGNLRA